jgi:four helix bundle protein
VEIVSFRDLIAWKKAMDLVVEVYTVSGHWPSAEVYGLTSQVRRAAVSVPSNIAEGQGRATRGEFVHHLGIAYGSLMEVQTQLAIATRLGFMPPEAAQTAAQLSAEVAKLLNGLVNSLTREN